ncbi:hypothetical protein G7046_g5140 [Stylonectria norvegica]|nr:hypothetical protein G7046_g5140 [Stylonectria norvegica]
MMSVMCLALGLLFCHVQARHPQCKSTPHDASWPGIAKWDHLNETLSGRLLRPAPPAQACHSSAPESNETCADIMKAWSTFAFHQDNPISTAWNNMNNDSCLPDSSAPCSGLGYSVYVVNATSAHHVKLAIDFARKNNIRLNVKASGHDYLQRQIHGSLFSLNLDEIHDWRLSIPRRVQTQGLQYDYKDDSCDSRRWVLSVDGMGPEVTLGGYLTGGGHSPLSHIYGLGSDQVYEVEMVTPAGDIITANECQNTDLFWAVRGGGGSTFGVLTKVTIRTVPSTPIAVYTFSLQAEANSSVYWEAISYLLAHFPALSASNVSAYTYLYPKINTTERGDYVSSFLGVFALPDPQSTTALEEMFTPLWNHINATYANQTVTKAMSTVFPHFNDMFLEYADDKGAGVDKVVGSWLLPSKTLTDDSFTDSLMRFLGESVTSQNWAPLNSTQKVDTERNINRVQTEALRRLAPDSGAYLNEAYVKEPDFQRAFWGSNYARLREIKHAVDPGDVFWCHVCVGSESAKTYHPRPYFRSRRIKKGTIDRPELRDKDPRGIWITLIPIFGFLAGLLAIALLTWNGYASVSNHKYCEVFVDDFSAGFNSTIWTKQVETGGFGNGAFELTTGSDENVFVRDGQLVIRATVQNESYIEQTKVTNLTADGTCTSSSPDDCILSANLTAGEIVQPVKSGRITTKNFAVIRYGRVDITANLAAGDWLLSQIIMYPAEDHYGAWPASGEIDVGISRGNNYTYGDGQGNQLVQSSLHWGPDATTDRWQTTTGARDALHSTYHGRFHTFGLEWTKDYLFTWVDSRLAQVTYINFNHDFFRLGGYGATYKNGSRILNPWQGTGTSHSTPFDRPFYLGISVGVGGTSGWFADGIQGKPWADGSTTPRKDFWDARDQWGPTWTQLGHGEMIVKKVSMWQQCDAGATDLSAFD